MEYARVSRTDLGPIYHSVDFRLNSLEQQPDPRGTSTAGAFTTTRYPNGFTLIELLVVIGILATLVSLLLPVVAGAKRKAHQVKCGSNQRQIGIGYLLYVDDNNDFYPVQVGHASVGGQKGNLAAEESGLWPLGTWVEPTQRPLNKYVDALEVFRCPADKGDPWRKIKSRNCFSDYGNSYLTKMADDGWRVRHVTGLLSPLRTPVGAVVSADHARPIKGSEVSRSASNKIIQGDWDWFPNHWVDDPRPWWHNYRGQHRFNMLFGDGHVEFYRFPEQAKNWGTFPAPNPSFTWW